MKEIPFDFDRDFESDEEALASMDELIMGLARDIFNCESGISVIIPEEVKLVGTAYKALRRIVKGKDIAITYELNTPFASMGAVSIVGKEVIVANPVLFAKTAEMASNFEVYPKTNGTVQMNFTFHNLARKAGN